MGKVKKTVEPGKASKEKFGNVNGGIIKKKIGKNLKSNVLVKKEKLQNVSPSQAKNPEKAAKVFKKLKSVRSKENKVVSAPETSKQVEEEEIEESMADSVCLLKNPNFTIDMKKDVLTSAVKSVKTLISLIQKEKTELFDEAQIIFMQVDVVKIPKCPHRFLRIPVPNTVLPENAEICLFVPDLEDFRKDHDKCIQHYENLLQTHDVNNVKAIIPLNKLKTEYRQYSMLHRLVNLYDFFLVDAKLAGRITKILGKVFFKNHKLPTPVKLEHPDIKKVVEKAISKVTMNIHSKGNTFTARIANNKMDDEKVVENIFSFIGGLEEQFPGGGENIETIYLKGATTKPVPIYCSLKNKSDVEIPVIKAQRPHAFKACTDELSTKSNSNIRVLPSGKVIVYDNLPKGKTQKKKMFKKTEEEQDVNSKRRNLKRKVTEHSVKLENVEEPVEKKLKALKKEASPKIKKADKKIKINASPKVIVTKKGKKPKSPMTDGMKNDNQKSAKKLKKKKIADNNMTSIDVSIGEKKKNKSKPNANGPKSNIKKENNPMNKKNNQNKKQNENQTSPIKNKKNMKKKN